MPRKYKESFFKWDEAQCFIGADGHIATTYTNDHITMTFMQSGTGELVGIAYETDSIEAHIELEGDDN